MASEQQMESKEAETFSWETWVKEGIKGLERTAVELGVRKEFFEHACAAQREAWAACRVLIEQFGDLVQKVTKGGKAPSSRPSQKIEVQ